MAGRCCCEEKEKERPLLHRRDGDAGEAGPPMPMPRPSHPPIRILEDLPALPPGVVGPSRTIFSAGAILVIIFMR